MPPITDPAMPMTARGELTATKKRHFRVRNKSPQARSTRKIAAESSTGNRRSTMIAGRASPRTRLKNTEADRNRPPRPRYRVYSLLSRTNT
ncbi:hypothetical protein ES703_119089 [subsurface metagenome]